MSGSDTIGKLEGTESTTWVVWLEQLTNRLLGLDPETLRRLHGLKGKVICICISGEAGSTAPMVIYVLPGETGLRLLTEHDAEPDVSLSGSLPALLRLVSGGATPDLFSSGNVEISGDLELGKRFERIMRKLDIDWEEQASHVIGDIAAHKLGNLVRDVHAWRVQAVETVCKDLGEYLQHESRILAIPKAVDNFMNAVDVVRADADRLEARLRRLQGSM
ncbi:MAG: SCP2 sterol-binding domain-containing protein [Gammaproteobacteria bacterium]|nr:SCP2 sterol-binding domain-containing protein [Gammaproteobacteria bacterium]